MQRPKSLYNVYLISVLQRNLHWMGNLNTQFTQKFNEVLSPSTTILNINFKRPARYDDLIKVKTQLSEKPTAKISFNYELFNDENDLLATGSTTLVFMDMEKNRPIRCPEDLLKKLS